MNCKLARITIPRDVVGSPREYVGDDDVPPTKDALALARWTVAIADTACYVVIDGDTMLAEYVVFEGEIFEPRRC
jgi:hypothetical protein